MELQRCENRVFFLPVNILMVWRASVLGCTTHCSVFDLSGTVMQYSQLRISILCWYSIICILNIRYSNFNITKHYLSTLNAFCYGYTK